MRVIVMLLTGKAKVVQRISAMECIYDYMALQFEYRFDKTHSSVDIAEEIELCLWVESLKGSIAISLSADSTAHFFARKKISSEIKIKRKFHTFRATCYLKEKSKQKML